MQSDREREKERRKEGRKEGRALLTVSQHVRRW
jgi:hypothetical protein